MSTIIYLNGIIYTMDAARPRARALAIDTLSGRILAVGENDEVRRIGGRDTELVDLGGKTMLPGFIDAHIHLLSTAYRAHYIDAEACTSEEAVAELVRQRAPRRRLDSGFRVVAGIKAPGPASAFRPKLRWMPPRLTTRSRSGAKMGTCSGPIPWPCDALA